MEHGEPGDKARALDHVLGNALQYSVDQYASKVIEKAIKNGGPETVTRYLANISESPAQCNRPRLPLIDIASDQYGN